jgi:hypothetical protein
MLAGLRGDSGECFARSEPVPVVALYGFSPTAEPLRGRSPADAVDWLLRHGFNGVFGYGQDPRLRDALAARGVRIFVEVALFQGQKYWRSHPGSQPIGESGRPLEREAWYAPVCPNQPWLWEEKLNVISRLARTRGISGIWLDFIRYPAHWEVKEPRLCQSCFCPVCLARFERDTGIQLGNASQSARESAQLILHSHPDRFTAWKVQRIVEFVRQARERVKAANPNMLLGLFGVPWRTEEHGGAIRTILAQDYRALAPYVDVFSPMVYHRMTGREVGWIADFTRYLQPVTAKPVLPIIQACGEPGVMEDEEFIQAVRVALKPPSAGVIVLSQSHMQREKRWGAWSKAMVSAAGHN